MPLRPALIFLLGLGLSGCKKNVDDTDGGFVPECELDLDCTLDDGDPCTETLCVDAVCTLSRKAPSIVLLETIVTQGPAHSVELRGDRLLVAEGSAGAAVYLLQPDGSPAVPDKRMPTAGEALQARSVNGAILVSEGPIGIEVFDETDCPGPVVRRSLYPTRGHVVGVVTTCDVAGVGCRQADGTCDFELCAPASCVPGDLCDPATGACVTDRCIAAGCAVTELCLDPLVGQCVPVPCGGACLPGTTCDVASNTCVADPCFLVSCSPPQVCNGGSCGVPCGGCGLWQICSGTCQTRNVVMATSYLGIEFIDFNSWDSPVAISEAKTPGLAYDLFSVGTDLFVAGGLAGVTRIDVTDLQVPVVVNKPYVDTEGRVVSIAIRNTEMFIGELGAGLALIDMSPTDGPERVFTMALGGDVLDIELFAPNTLIVAANEVGLIAVDLLDRSNPQVWFEESTAGPAVDVDLDGELIAVAMNRAGVAIYDLKCTPPPPPP